MLINDKKTKRVKFISYTGSYPSLCMGVLTLEIDGVEYRFGDIDYIEDKTNKVLDIFWRPGGSCYYKDNENDYVVEKKEWVIDVESLPEELHGLANEIDSVFNENVPFGCCGGCI